MSRLSISAKTHRRGLPTLKSASAAPVLSIGSQGLGVVQLALLLSQGGATASADAYFYLLTLGVTPTLVLTVGVLYPSLLNSRTLDDGRARWTRLLSFGLSVTSVAFGTLWVHANRPETAYLAPIAIGLAANAAVQSQSYYFAVCADAIGRPKWTACLALPANALACIVLIPRWPSSGMATAVMVSALVAGNTAFLLGARKSDVRLSLNATDSGTASARSRYPYWFLIRAVSGNLAQVVVGSLAVALAASAVTIINVVGKVVGSLGVTITGALLTKMIHRTSAGRDQALSFVRWTTTAVVLAATPLVLIGTVAAEQNVLLVLVSITWLAASPAATVASRLSYRHLPPRASIRTVGATWSILAWTVALFACGAGSSTILVASLGLLDALVAGVLFAAMRMRKHALLAGGMALACVGLQLLSIAGVAS
jgi:hypothetical protein